MAKRENSPLINKEITLRDDTKVKIFGWFDSNVSKSILNKHMKMINKFKENHPSITNYDNILVGMDTVTQEAILVDISDIVGYVKETT